MTVPVEALDQGIPCAAFSKKEKWYDRTLLFRAGSLPEEAWRRTLRLPRTAWAWRMEATGWMWPWRGVRPGRGGVSGKLTVRDGQAKAGAAAEAAGTMTI